MSRTLTIARRELSGFFLSPIAYIVLFLMFVAMGVVFGTKIFVPGKITEVRQFFEYSQLFLFFLIPPLTMGLFSEEYKSGRIEVLRTSPITEAQLLTGKFIATFIFYCFILAMTLVYLFILMAFGRPDFGAVLSSYIGMLLMGALYVAIGIFFSACTQDQIVALLSSFLTLGALTFLEQLTNMLAPVTDFFGKAFPLRSIVEYFGTTFHTADFLKGTIDVSHIVYFASGTVLFLFFTYLILESRRWR
jgi:ABC-2 type transport system permease protein